MQHDDGEQRKHRRERVAVQKQNTEILQVKAKKRRVATDFVNARRDERGLVFVRDAGAPAVPHADNGEKKEQVAEQSDEKTGKACARGQTAPVEYDGQQLCSDHAERCDTHQQLDGMNAFFLPAADLPRLNAAPFLQQRFCKVDPVEHCQHEQRQQRIRQRGTCRMVHCGSSSIAAIVFASRRSAALLTFSPDVSGMARTSALFLPPTDVLPWQSAGPALLGTACGRLRLPTVTDALRRCAAYLWHAALLRRWYRRRFP